MSASSQIQMSGFIGIQRIWISVSTTMSFLRATIEPSPRSWDSGEEDKGISLCRSVIAVAQDLDGDHSIHDSLHANPQRLRARFAVALAPEESARRRDHPYHLVERRWLFRTRLFTEHVSAVYLVSREEQRRVQLRTGSSDTYEPRDTVVVKLFQTGR
jgi:hypothetical protein